MENKPISELTYEEASEELESILEKSLILFGKLMFNGLET